MRKPDNIDKLIKAIRIEQDKITRHACAEAILSQTTNSDGCDMLISRCHAAVMNCREGLKDLK